MTCKKFLSKIAFLTLLFVAVSGCKTEDRELERYSAALDSLSLEFARQQQKIDSLQNLLGNTEIETRQPIIFGRDFDTISNPQEYIVNSLKQRNELIPLDAVLGGTMEFREVQVLTEDWVLAIYDDGHVQGKSIYEYNLQSDGSISFEEVVSKLPANR